jgi:uncharacterized SAM-binding protein YcdF (DUF218 family)
LGSARTEKHSRLIGLVVGALAGMIVESLGLAPIVSYWGDDGPVVVIGALVGAAVWPTALRGALGVTAAALSIVWLTVAFTPFVGWLAADASRSDPLRPADAAFVFASGIQRSGELSTVATSRIVHGLEIVAQGMAPTLVVSDLAAPFPSYVGAAKRLRDHLGIHGDVVAIGGNKNTHDEALALARLCRERGWKRVVAVTSPVHTRRACGALEATGIDVVCSPSAEPRYEIGDLERSKERRLAFSETVHEKIGIWLYRRRGWLGGVSEARDARGDPSAERDRDHADGAFEPERRPTEVP